MHDPLTVAFEIRRPWPRRDRSQDSIRPCRPDKPFPRWRFKLHHDCAACNPDERAEHAGKRIFPWYRPSSWTPFWTVAGRGFYWPALITIWHSEPKGRDSGEVCRHYTRTQNAAGKWTSKIHHGWRWHVHHWRIQVLPLQSLRRWALTRCTWCGGKSRKGDRVNISHSWDGPRGHWWQGQPGLYHHDCSSIATAHRTCLCAAPITEHEKYGRCARCDRFRPYGRQPTAMDLLLSDIPAGQRDPAVYATVSRMWESARKAEVS